MYLVISESAFLLLEPEGKKFAKLILWATLYSLTKLERDMETPNKLILHWQQMWKMVLRMINTRINLSKNYI